MLTYWSKFKQSLSFRHFGVLAAFCAIQVCHGQTASMGRKPANYVPDDDVIAAPVNNELSFYQQYVASDKSEDVARSRNQLKVWNDNQIFADQYGLDSTLTGSGFFVPTGDEKWEYFKNKYMRYLRGRGEQPLKDLPKTWYQDYRASNEIDTIDEMESRFKATTTKTKSGKDLPESLQAKEVNIWKKTRFIFQPRLDQGLVIVGFKSPIAYARAWVGINGKAEMNIQQTYESIGLRLMFNYYADSGRYFSSVDQRIVENVYARFTSNKDPQHEKGTPYQDDSLMLLYAKQF